jgi:hypothetical protein
VKPYALTPMSSTGGTPLTLMLVLVLVTLCTRLAERLDRLLRREREVRALDLGLSWWSG